MTITRKINFAIFIMCLFLLGFGLFLEHFKGLEPCPLCVFQRMAYIGLLIISLLAIIHAPKGIGNYIYSGLLILISVAGLGIAGRQVWLQHLPADKVPECGPGLDYILDAFPLNKALQMIFSGSGECAEVQWQFIGFSIAEWSLFWFLMIIIVSGSIFYKKQTIHS